MTDRIDGLIVADAAEARAVQIQTDPAKLKMGLEPPAQQRQASEAEHGPTDPRMAQDGSVQLGTNPKGLEALGQVEKPNAVPAPVGEGQGGNVSTSEQVREKAAGTRPEKPWLPADLMDKAGARVARDTARVADEGGLLTAGVELAAKKLNLQTDEGGVKNVARALDTTLQFFGIPSSTIAAALSQTMQDLGISEGVSEGTSLAATLAGALAMPAFLPKFLGALRTAQVPKEAIPAIERIAQRIVDLHNADPNALGSSYSLTRGNLKGQPLHAVSIFPEMGSVIEGRAMTKDDVVKHLQKNPRLATHPDVFSGTWTDKSTGKTHIDYSVGVDAQKAGELGRRYRQIKNFDLEKGEEVDIPGNFSIEKGAKGHRYEPAENMRPEDVEMADVYAKAPTFQPEAKPAWDALAAETDKMYADLTKRVEVIKVTGQPYANAAEMNADIAKGRFKVTTDNSEHPVWDVEQNFRFRVVHDYLGHFEGGDFSLEGEWRAFQKHAALINDPLAREALEVEIYGQAAAAIANRGEFQIQKVFLPSQMRAGTTMSDVQLPSIADRLADIGGSRVGGPFRDVPLASRLEHMAAVTMLERQGTPKSSLALGAAGVGAGVAASDEESPEMMAAGIAMNLPLMKGINLADLKPRSRPFSALASVGAAKLARGISSKAEWGAQMLQQFGPEIEPHLPALFEKAKDVYSSELKEVRKRLFKFDEVVQYFRHGDQFPDWYGARQELIEFFGDDALPIARLTAATSTQMAVEPNVEAALRVYELWKTGRADEIVASNRDLITMFKVSGKGMLPNIYRAMDGLPLNGNKVNDYLEAIWGDESRFTTDRHMVKLIFKNADDAEPLSDAKYALASEWGREFAAWLSGGVRWSADLVAQDAQQAARGEWAQPSDAVRPRVVSPRYAQQALWVGYRFAQELGDSPTLLKTYQAKALESGVLETVARYRAKAGEAGAVEKMYDDFDFGSSAMTAKWMIAAAAAAGAAGGTDEDVVNGAAMAVTSMLVPPRLMASAIKAVKQLRSGFVKAGIVVTPAYAEAQKFATITSNEIRVGDKLLAIDWSAMGRDHDAIETTLQKLKQIYDVEGVHPGSRGVIGQELEKQMARKLVEMGFDEATMLKRKAGDAWNSTMTQAAIDLTGAALKRLDELEAALNGAKREQAMTGALTPNPAQAATLEEFMTQMGVAAGLVKQLDGIFEEAGRTLRMAQSAPQDLGRSRLDFLRQYQSMTDAGTMTGIEQLPQMWSQLPLTGQKVHFLRLAASHGLDLIKELFYDSTLFTFKGQVANIIGSAQSTLEGPILHWIASGIGKARTSVGLGPDERVHFAQGTARFHGMMAALMDATVASGKTFATGESQFGGSATTKLPQRAISGARLRETLNAASLDVPTPLLKAVDTLGFIAGVGPRALLSEDEWFKVVNFTSSMYGQAMEEGLKKNLTGAELSEFVKKFVTQQPEHAVKIAKEEAHYATYTTPLTGLNAALAKVAGSTVMLPFTPFFKALVNLTKFEFEHIPGLNMLVKKSRDAILTPGPQQDLALAKLALGTTVMLIGGWYYFGGKVTGPGPADPNIAARLKEDMDWKPYAWVSDNADGTKSYTQINRLEPAVAPFLLAANFYDRLIELEGNELSWDKADEIGLAAALAIGEMVTSKNWMGGFREALETFTVKNVKDAEAQGKFLMRAGAAVVPTGVAQWWQGIHDPLVRETFGLMDTIKAKTPYSTDLYPKLKLNGDAIFRSPSLGPDWASPLPHSKGKPDPVSMVMVQNRISIDMPDKTLEGPTPAAIGPTKPSLPLNPKQWHEYVRLAGNGLKAPAAVNAKLLNALGYEGATPTHALGAWDLLTHIVQTPAFDKLTDGPDGGKANVVKGVLHSFRKDARTKLIMGDEALKKAFIQKKLEDVGKLAGEAARSKVEQLLPQLLQQ